MSTSSHISPRRRGIIPEIDFVQWIIHPAWMGKRGGHVRREETWPRDRRFIRSIRRRCDLDVISMGLESIEALHPPPLKGRRKTRPYPIRGAGLQHFEGTNRDRLMRVQRSRNNARRGRRDVCVYRETYTVSNGRWIGRSIKRGTNGEREPANELEGRSGLKTRRKMGERERGRVSWRIERAIGVQVTNRKQERKNCEWEGKLGRMSG